MPSEESYKEIEGDWKDFRFRRIQPEDHAAVLEQIAQNYVRDEAVEQLLGWNREFADEVTSVVEYFLKDGLSFLAEHIPTGKVAAARITCKHTPDIRSFESFNLKTRGARMFFKFVDDIEAMGDLPNKRGIQTWAGFMVASTTREFRNQGLAGEFYNRSIKFLRAEGFKHALVVVTSPWTKQATKTRDFEQLARLNYDDLVDYEGQPMFKKEELNPDHHFALLMLKTL